MTKFHRFMLWSLYIGLFVLFCYPSGPLHGEMLNTFELKHTEGGGIGYKKRYSSAELFSAYRPNASQLFFADLRGHYLSHRSRCAGNIGFGYRQQIGCSQSIFGINGYYDARGVRKKCFQQLGLGVEYLSDCFDVRCNGYFPIGTKKDTIDCDFDRFRDHSIYIKHRFYRHLGGIDGEVGKSLFCSKTCDLYGAIGSYSFSKRCWPFGFSKKENSTSLGGKIRLQGNFWKYYTTEISDSYDKLFRNNFQCYFSINIPFWSDSKPSSSHFSCSYPCGIAMAFFSQKPSRQEIIPVYRTHEKKKLKNQKVIHVDNTSGVGNGTFENPYATIELAQEDSKKGDIIYVRPGNGSSYGNIVLKDDQLLLGSGRCHQLKPGCGTITIPALTLPCQAPTLFSETENVVVLADRNTVSGFNIVGDGIERGIRGDGVDSATISYNKISNCFHGILLITIEKGRFEIKNNEIYNSTWMGTNIGCVGGSPLFILDQNNIHDCYSGIYNHSANDSSPIWIVKNNCISNNRDSGLWFFSSDNSKPDITIMCNKICNNGLGIVVDGDGSSSFKAVLAYNYLGNNLWGIWNSTFGTWESNYVMIGNRIYNSGFEDIIIDSYGSGTVFLDAFCNDTDNGVLLENNSSNPFTVKAEDQADFEEKNSFGSVTTDGINYSP